MIFCKNEKLKKKIFSSPSKLRGLHRRQLLRRVTSQDVRHLVRQHRGELFLGLQNAQQASVHDDFPPRRDHRVDVFRVVDDDKLPLEPPHVASFPSLDSFAVLSVGRDGSEPPPDALDGARRRVPAREKGASGPGVPHDARKRRLAEAPLELARDEDRVPAPRVRDRLPRRVVDRSAGRERRASEQGDEARPGAERRPRCPPARVVFVVVVEASAASPLVLKALVAVVPVGAPLGAALLLVEEEKMGRSRCR